MLAATIALADAPAWSALAARVQRYILASMPHALATFAPDGVWPESPGYQGYTVSELVHGAAALISATGSDEGLLGGPGVCGTGIVSAYNAGPSLNIFNRGDSTPTHPSSDQLFFLSQHCRMPVYAALARTFYNGAGSASAESDNLIWFSGAGSDADILALPLARAFVDPSLDRSRGAKTHFVSFREAWLQPNASWVALKGGDNYFYDGGSNSHNNHGHLDVGAFVLESNGVRWAVELGSGAYDYPLLAYFGRFRFGYAFTSSVTHNVLRFDDVTQNRRGQGRIVATSDAVALNDHDAASASVAAAAGVPAWALFDTTSAYGGAVTVLRNVSLSGRITRVADSWIHPFATSAYFQFATTSSVSLHGSSATLYDAETGSSLLVTATAARGGRIEWTAPRLQLKVPQIDTYDGLLVYMVTIEVPATEGGVSVSFEPVPLAMKQ